MHPAPLLGAGSCGRALHQPPAAPPHPTPFTRPPAGRVRRGGVAAGAAPGRGAPGGAELPAAPAERGQRGRRGHGGAGALPAARAARLGGPGRRGPVVHAAAGPAGAGAQRRWVRRGAMAAPATSLPAAPPGARALARLAAGCFHAGTFLPRDDGRPCAAPLPLPPPQAGSWSRRASCSTRATQRWRACWTRCATCPPPSWRATRRCWGRWCRLACATGRTCRCVCVGGGQGGLPGLGGRWASGCGWAWVVWRGVELGGACAPASLLGAALPGLPGLAGTAAAAPAGPPPRAALQRAGRSRRRSPAPPPPLPCWAQVLLMCAQSIHSAAAPEGADPAGLLQRARLLLQRLDAWLQQHPDSPTAEPGVWQQLRALRWCPVHTTAPEPGGPPPPPAAPPCSAALLRRTGRCPAAPNRAPALPPLPPGCGGAGAGGASCPRGRGAQGQAALVPPGAASGPPTNTPPPTPTRTHPPTPTGWRAPAPQACPGTTATRPARWRRPKPPGQPTRRGWPRPLCACWTVPQQRFCSPRWACAPRCQTPACLRSS
jgi:hypothetical protein